VQTCLFLLGLFEDHTGQEGVFAGIDGEGGDDHGECDQLFEEFVKERFFRFGGDMQEEIDIFQFGDEYTCFRAVGDKMVGDHAGLVVPPEEGE